ncbi:hypothetical protein BDZ45DRAFT_663248 [Acephala macrosclerotiorum]|nr:hypothetical protein BDZ45DRAFT_663248 [Acephala macrosclerotiorum]
MQYTEHGVPYLSLPAPHTNVRLTPPRKEDGPAVISILNHPLVYMNLAGPPYSYIQKDWDTWYPELSEFTNKALWELQAAEDSTRSGDTKNGSGVPLSTIREVDSETGEESLIGEINFRRREFLTVLDVEERKRVKMENDARDAGDPGIVWEIGFYLSPTCHGRGIMPAVIRTLINEFLVPYMNVHIMTKAYIKHNEASRKVLKKNGFVFESFVPDCVKMPEAKTGVKGTTIGLGRTKWEKKSSHQK